MSQPVRWGIVGPGRIAHSFAKDLKLIPGGALTAVGSRNRANAEAFAKEYGAEHSFGSYDELFRSDTVDAIYIATPHTSHAELSIRAMNHGKHVLCEKPMGINRTEVEQMLETAARNKVFLMEALWSRFNPTIKKAKQLITEGAIGKIRYLYADFAFYALDRDEGGRLLNPDLGGGSILDIGIYPIFLSYLILGMPKKIQASSKIYKTGAEVQTAMLFDYQEAQALLYSGLTSKSSMKAEISGSEGSIFIHPRWHESQGYSIEKEGDIASFELPTNGKGYSYEIEEVHDCLKKGELQSDFWSHQNSLDLVKLMDAVRAKSDITFPFEK